MKFVMAFLSLVLLGGCSTSSFLKSTEPPQTIYSLRAADPAPDAQTGPARILEIAKPSVPPGFATDRIALYTDDGRKLDYYAGAKWPAMLDDLVQDVTRRSTTNILPYVVAVTPDQSLGADFRLHVKVNEFQPVYGERFDAAPRLVVNVEFTLMSLPDERILRSFSLTRQAVADSDRLDSITAGLETMLQDIEAEAFARMDSHLKKQPSL